MPKGIGKAGLLTYGLKDWYWSQNPATSLDWAEDDLDGVDFGVRRTA